MYRILLPLIALSALLASCIEEFDPTLDVEGGAVISVDGTLISDTLCLFHINWISNKQQVDADHPNAPVKGAELILWGNDTSIQYGYWLYDDVYGINPMLAPGVLYSLVIMGDDFSVRTTLLDPCYTPPVSDLRCVQDSSDWHIDYYVSSAPSDILTNENGVQYMKYSYLEDWKVVTFYKSPWEYDPDQGFYLRGYDNSVGWKNDYCHQLLVTRSSDYQGGQIQDFPLAAYQNTDERFYTRFRQRVIQRAISREEYDYNVARRNASNDLGGLFSPMPSELPTNLEVISDLVPGRNLRVTGFVGAAYNVASRDLYVNRDDLKIKYAFKSEMMKNDDKDWPGLDEIYHWGWRCCYHYNDMMYGFCTPKSVDATAWGAVLFPPDDWIDR